MSLRGHRSWGHLQGHDRRPSKVAGTSRRSPSFHLMQKSLRHQEMRLRIAREDLREMLDP